MMLEARDVAVGFGGVRALEGVTVGVDAGEVVGLIGPNGAGKSTLLDCISGFLVPDRGTVVLDGDDVSDRYPYERAALGLGRSFQDVRLFGGFSAAEILRVAAHARVRSSLLADGLRTRRARRAERLVDAAVAEAIAIVDLSPYLEVKAADLSYGTLRMLELACLLVAGGRVLLLDEPASGIAQREAEALGPLLRRIAATGVAVLLVEHDQALLMGTSDRVYALDLGQVIATGTPAEVQADSAVLASYLGVER